MKKDILSLASFLCLLTSCTKSVNNRVGSTDSSLVQFISVNPSNDSLTNNYLFDDEDYLIKQWTDDSNYPALYPVTEYTRDEEKRVIKKTAFGINDTLITDVHYAVEMKLRMLSTILLRIRQK